MKREELEVMSLVELRKLSRGKFSGGYSMKKPDLINALLRIDRNIDNPPAEGHKAGLKVTATKEERKSVKDRIKSAGKKATKAPYQQMRVAHAMPASKRMRHRKGAPTTHDQIRIPRLIRKPDPNGGTNGVLVADAWVWRHTQVPAWKRAQKRHAANKRAKQARKVNR